MEPIFIVPQVVKDSMSLFTFLSCAEFPVRTSRVKSSPADAPYVILDVETTGKFPGEDKIIQLSAIKYSAQGIATDTYNTYLDPGRPIPSRITKLTGITDDMVWHQPTAGQVRGRFLSFLSDLVLVGYNVTFDLRFLASEFGDTLVGRKYMDVCQIAKQHIRCPDYKLSTVAGACGFSPKNGFHNALTDCEAVAAVLSHLNLPVIEEFTSTFNSPPPYRKPDTAGDPAYPKRVDLKSITPQTTSIDPQHPLFQKKIVFTGTLRMERAEAAQLAVNAGAVVRFGVSSKTDFLVVGAQDVNFVGEDGMSEKQEKAFALNQSGKAHIKIISENEFLQMIQKGALV